MKTIIVTRKITVFVILAVKCKVRKKTGAMDEGIWNHCQWK